MLIVIAMWKLFEKAGKPGWHAIIPFLNIYDLFQIAWSKKIGKAVMIVSIAGAGAMFIGAIIMALSIGTGLTFFLDVSRLGGGALVAGFLVIMGWLALMVTAVFMIICYVKLGQAFGKSGGFLVGMVLLSVIFICILAFGPAQYQGYWDDEGFHPNPYGPNPGQQPYPNQAPYPGQPMNQPGGYPQNNMNAGPAMNAGAPMGQAPNTGSIPEPPRYCSGCGSLIQPGSKFCASCGKQFGQ